MSRKNEFYILIKWHYNPTTNEVGKKKHLPVLMLDSDGDPLEFDDKGALTEYGSEQFIALSNTGDSSAGGTNNYDNVDTFDPESENKPFTPTPPKNDPNSKKTVGSQVRNENSVDVSQGVNQ